VDCERVRGLIEQTSGQREAQGFPRCRYALFSATYSDQIMANVRDFVPRTHKRNLIQLHKNEVCWLVCTPIQRRALSSLSLSLSHTHTHSIHTLPLSHTHSPSHTLSFAGDGGGDHTHRHTHILSLPLLSHTHIPSQVMVEEIAQLYVDVRDPNGYEPPRGEQQRRKGAFCLCICMRVCILGGRGEGCVCVCVWYLGGVTAPDGWICLLEGVYPFRPYPFGVPRGARNLPLPSPPNSLRQHTHSHTPIYIHTHIYITNHNTEDFVVSLLKERTITGKVVIFVQSKRSCQQLADRLKQMRHLEVREG
jgi:hypothetical protein